jgi:hypothetical protein
MKNYDDLIKKYPLLFEHPEGSQEPFALFGFECDIGWYHIIDKACEAIYSKYRSAKSSVEFWKERLADKKTFISQLRRVKEEENKTDEEIIKDRQDYLNNLIIKLKAIEETLPKVVQVKEKFGTLRFYIENGKDSDYDIASFAESMSEVTCEKCGNIGTTYTMGWHKTLCKEHAIAAYGEDKVEKYNQN